MKILSTSKIVWHSSQSSNSLKGIGPLTDNTYKNDYGHYGLFDSSGVTKGTRIVVNSPETGIYSAYMCYSLKVTLPFNDNEPESFSFIRILLVDPKGFYNLFCFS